MDRRLQAFGGRWSHVQAFRGIRGSSCTYLWKHTWIVECKPLVAYVDRRLQVFGGRWTRLQAFGGWHGSPLTSLWSLMQLFAILWWYTWIVVYKPVVANSALYKPFVADGVIYNPLVPYVDRHSQAFGGLRGSPFTSLSWHTWIVVYMPLVAYVDRRLQAFGG